jgi:nicotinamidase-related amidase
MQSTTHRIVRERAALAVIDIQERLLPVMHEKDRVVQNAVRLIRAAEILKIPLLVTEQYRKGVGATVPEVAAAISRFAPVEKLAFSRCGADGFVEGLKQRGVQDVVLCGIEAHVCVAQTCLDLLDLGFRPFVVADAVSSRTAENHQFGIARMRDAGAVITSTEMIIFELLGRAGTDEFKQVLPLIK